MPRRGENIYKRKDGRWEGRYQKGHVNGKIKYGYVYAKTYKGVKEKLNNLPQYAAQEKAEALTKKGCSPEKKFEIIAQLWLQELKPQLKDSSIIKYSNLLSTYLFPAFGDSLIEAITKEEISEFTNNLLLTGGRKETGLSTKTVSSVLSVLKSVFEYAVQSEQLDVVTIEKSFIKQSPKPLRILSMPEQKKLSNYLYDNLTLTNLGILLCLYTGIRIGEVCALKWEDISISEQSLYVHKTMQRIQNKELDENCENKTSVLISSPKSECSIRKIPLPDEIFKLIEKMHYPENTFFLTGKIYDFMEPRTLQYRFKAVLKSCDIQDANFHALRHTFATRCVELGFDVKSLSEILGHASVNITMNRYVHPSMELKQQNMNMFSDLLPVK